MTRINLIEPSKLSGRHLVAEYRELPRVFGLARKYTGDCSDLPKAYTMGKGHVRFFYNKLGWLIKRQRKLIREMQRRGYEPKHTDPSGLLDGVRDCLCNDWRPTRKDKAISEARIQERLG